MSSCVNIKLKEFIELQKASNLSTSLLKLLVYLWQNTFGEETFPTEEWIQKALKGESLEFGENSLLLYKEGYSEPLEVEASVYKEELRKAMLIFPKAAVSSYKMANGNYIILVAQPSNLKENAEQALAYGRDKKSKEIFLQKILGSMRHVRAYKTSNGELLFYAIIPEGSSKSNVELYESFKAEIDNAIIRNNGNPSDFYLSDRVSRVYENGKFVEGFHLIPNSTKNAPTNLETSMNQRAEQLKMYLQQVYKNLVFDAMKHENLLVDKLLRELWRKELEDEESGIKILLKPPMWQTLRGEEILSILPQRTVKKVAKLISEYANSKNRGLAQSVAKDIYFSNTDEIAAKDVLEEIIKNSKNKELVFLAKLIKNKLLTNPKVSFSSQEGNTRGRHLANGNIIIYERATYGETVEDGIEGLERTILHELSHEISVDTINSNETFRASIAEIMGELSDYLVLNNIEDFVYALKNEKEFMAEFMSLPFFRESLKHMAIKSKNGKPISFFQKILNKIASIFTNGRKGTLYSLANKALKALLDSESKIDIINRIEDLELAEANKEELTKTEELTKSNEEIKDKVLELIYQINKQYNQILLSLVLTGQDITEATNIIADMISDKIDEMFAKKEEVKQILLNKNPNDKTDISSLSRLELINSVGLLYFLDLVKLDFIRNKRTASAENRAKITEVIKNWDFFISRSKNIVSSVEKFHISISESGEKTISIDGKMIELFDEDGKSVQDLLADGQLSWQVEPNTIDPVTSLALNVMLLLRPLYVLKDTGKIDENGNPIYTHVKTKWGTDAKVGTTAVTKYLLRWISNKETLKDMIKAIEEKKSKAPWVTLLLPILLDTTGEYSILQSLFFSNFYKPFMKFSSVTETNGKLTLIQLNEHPFLTLTLKIIESSYMLGDSPLINNGLQNGYNILNQHYLKLTLLANNFDKNEELFLQELQEISKILGFEIDTSELLLNTADVKDLLSNLGIINNAISKNINNPDYNPFTYSTQDYGIRNNFMRFFEKISDLYEDLAVTSFYEGGKLRQSYLLPSYLTMFTNKFHLDEKAFINFINDEFNSEFFRDLLESNIVKGWKCVWLQQMMLNPKMRANFSCKTNITFNGDIYMKGMSPNLYALAMITEFFSELSKESDSVFLANFRVPIESNKPSAEYIKFYARGGVTYKQDLVDDFIKVFEQELLRIKTVVAREDSRNKSLERLEKLYKDGKISETSYKNLVFEINQKAIEHFDSRGKLFLWLDFLNWEVAFKTELGELIEASIHGKLVDEALMSQLVSESIYNNILKKVDSILNNFASNGILKECEKIEGFTRNNARNRLELMLWNDAFALTQILQLLISDPAFYKNTDDILKRMAQVHSSGNRGNVDATDFEGNPVSDHYHRSITLKDEEVVSNIIENLTIYFDRKIENTTGSDRIAWIAFKDKLVGEKGLYRKINIADGLAYSCPTSYRKKAFIFGMWDKNKEKTYQKIKKGDATISEIISTFQPFKPFLFGNSIESTGIELEGTMSKVRVSTLNKNAECLLIMADAMLAGEDTGKPNLLRAIFNVMEQSHFLKDGVTYKTDGIDTVNFESAVKTGKLGKIDSLAYVNTNSNGIKQESVTSIEKDFEALLHSLIYNTKEIENDGELNSVITYNNEVVRKISFLYYCMLLSIPEHFVDHSQLEGSQQRAIILSNLASVDEFGNTIYYKVGPNKTEMTAEQMKDTYELLHKENINIGIQKVLLMFNLTGTAIEKKLALSKLLVYLFLSDGRYTGDMLYMVTLNEETGDFPISLTDPSIINQVEQAINSIIKDNINKLRVKGGPLVLMSNFGMSKELKIKFRNKQGELLETREEYEKRINTERNERVLRTDLSRSIEIRWNQEGSSEDSGLSKEGQIPSGLYDGRSSKLFTDVSKRVAEVSDKISDELSKRNIRATSQKVKLATPEEFHKAISEAKASNKNGWMVDVHEVSDYFNDILFLTEDGKSGIAVTKEGDIISVFSAVSHDSRLSKLMQMAIAAGGKKLDCFYMDGTKNLGLPDIYKDFGFITDATNPLDESFLGDDYKEWVKNNPDKKVKGVAAMHLSNPNSIENFGEYENSHTTDAPILLGENGYDDMIAVRDKNIENIENPLSYEDYLKNNQAGIDHYEILAPAYTEAIFLKFTDSNGNISVDAIELLNPELLKMIGYRIPTEAKYSIAPLKIVGFTPREMGDVIILPADITLINGSDFDVDKEYCIRKQLNIVEKELDDNKLVEHLFTKLGKKESKEKQATIYKIANDFIDKPYDKKYWKDKGFTEDLYKRILSIYVNLRFKIKDPKSQIDKNNNDIFDISYAIMTHESTVAKALKPGGFEDFAHFAYAATAWKLGKASKDFNSFSDFLKMSTDFIKTYITKTDKNLIYLDTLLDYYSINNSASSLLSISAVNATSHNILVDDNIGVITEDLNIPEIAGFKLENRARLDPALSINKEEIDETIGSCIGASADAAKEPVLSLANLTPQNFNIFITLIRLGMPRDKALLFMSNSVMDEALYLYNKASVSKELTNLEGIFKTLLLGNSNNFLGVFEISEMLVEPLTEQELIDTLANLDDKIKRKYCLTVVKLFELAKRILLVDTVTRFNSISSAVGPTMLDNYVDILKLQLLSEDSFIVDMSPESGYNVLNMSDIFDKHPMLKAFSLAHDIALSILVSDLPINNSFLKVIEHFPSVQEVLKEPEIPKIGIPTKLAKSVYGMKKLREFFINYIAVNNGLVNYDEISEICLELPKLINSKKLQHKGNYLVDNLYVLVSKKTGIAFINIGKTEKNVSSNITQAWADLYKVDKDFAINLLKYNFFKGGLFFNPNSLITNLPILIKQDLPSYINTFKLPLYLTDKEILNMYDLFVRNNYKNDDIVPTKKRKTTQNKIIIKKENPAYSNLPYFKVFNSYLNKYVLYKCMGSTPEAYRVYNKVSPLGLDGAFLEISTSTLKESAFDFKIENTLEDDNQIKKESEEESEKEKIDALSALQYLDKILTKQQLLVTKERVQAHRLEARQEYIDKVSKRLTEVLKEKGFNDVDEEVFNNMKKILNLC